MMGRQPRCWVGDPKECWTALMISGLGSLDNGKAAPTLAGQPLCSMATLAVAGQAKMIAKYSV